ncbi:protease B nonderepressible form [Paraconiothyrium brasiliense]|uniref:Protein PBN1 n=1 Tax=Paraconiothyrium brasiliense TaxID=300254 RepID=A0ABR3RV17_9PLEO
MKQRRTYLVGDPDSFTPEQLEVKDGSLWLKGLKAVAEHRVTFNVDELPKEVRKFLKQWQELHIKWASMKPFTAIPPFTSRVTPGLHVLYEPHNTQPKVQLCDLLRSVFDPENDCSFDLDAEEIATPVFHATVGEESDASLQYYSYLPSLHQLVSLIEESFCPKSSDLEKCIEYANSLLKASYLDIDFSASSTNLVLTAFFDSPTHGWTTHVPAPSHGHTIEVGVLTHEPNPDPEDIAFGGFLTVLGPDAAPKPTRFQTPTRHYPLSYPLTYMSRFAHPTGLHPTLELSFPSAQLIPPDETCKLYTHLTLPSYLFIDKYQFNDPLFLSSHLLASLLYVTGATDLEAPEWVVSRWGSTALFRLVSPKEFPEDIKEQEWTVTIPLHLRYLPVASSSHTRVPVPWPVVFWACDAEQDSSGNPFDRKNLGYDSAFAKEKRFMHVPPNESGNGTGNLVNWIDVPVLDSRAADWVEMGTIGVVIVAFLGLCWVLFKGGRGKRGKGMEEKVKKKQ